MGEWIRIRDIEAKELDIFARMNERQLKNINGREEGLFIAESPKVISRALMAGYSPVCALVEERQLTGPGKEEASPNRYMAEVEDILSRCGSIPVYAAPFEELKKLTGYCLTRGMLLAMKRKPLPDPGLLIRGMSRLVILEEVVNPTNLGAIFRSAAALSMDAVLLSPACSDPLYRRAARVSMGTVFQIPWTYLTGPDFDWPEKAISSLQAQGFKTLSMALIEDAVSLSDPRLQREEKLAIIMGTEGGGLRPATIRSCDYTVKIPMRPGVDSLNVAAASAVAFYTLGAGPLGER